MKRRELILGTSCAVMAMGTGAVIAPMAAAGESPVPQMFYQILDATNSQRAAHKRRALRRNNALIYAAETYARRLAGSEHFSHQVGGSSLPERVERTGYKFHRLAENIGWAERPGSPIEIANWFVSAWMESPGHRRNLLDARLKEIGIGVARRGPRFFAVQVFGTRV